jgi:hypothetical protein
MRMILKGRSGDEDSGSGYQVMVPSSQNTGRRSWRPVLWVKITPGVEVGVGVGGVGTGEGDLDFTPLRCGLASHSG